MDSEEGHGRRGRVLAADYRLVHRNRTLALTEAKACDKVPAEGAAQLQHQDGRAFCLTGEARTG